MSEKKFLYDYSKIVFTSIFAFILGLVAWRIQTKGLELFFVESKSILFSAKFGIFIIFAMISLVIVYFFLRKKSNDKSNFKELTEEEKDILRFSYDDGIIYKYETDKTGIFVKTNKKDFLRDSKIETKRYNEALESLIDKKMVEYKSGVLYELTVKGYDVAKEII